MKKILCLCCAFVLAACVHKPTVPEGFQSKMLSTTAMEFLIWEKEPVAKEPLHVYIEGSGDPNPARSQGLILAGKDKRPNVVYLTQPCQYTDIPECANEAIWKEARYDIGIVNEMTEAILGLAKRYKTNKIELIGYDSGAALAMLLAPRTGADRIITIAGILDTDAYQAYHSKTPLSENNLNPAHELRKTAQIPQIHYVGTDDKDVPFSLTKRFIAGYNGTKSVYIKQVRDMGHTHWDDVPFDFYQ